MAEYVSSTNFKNTIVIFEGINLFYRLYKSSIVFLGCKKDFIFIKKRKKTI